MKSSQSEASTSPSVHSENIRRELSQLIDHLEADIHRVDDERFRRLLDKSAEVLKGLRTLFERVGSGGDERRDQRPTPVPAGKRGENKKAAPPPKSKPSAASAVGKKLTTNASVRAPKAGTPSRKRAAGSQPPQRATTTTPAPTAAAKSPDPDEIAAQAQQQRREARAPKMPGGHAAPRPVPPQSGKPVWSRPHSS